VLDQQSDAFNIAILSHLLNIYEAEIKSTNSHLVVINVQDLIVMFNFNRQFVFLQKVTNKMLATKKAVRRAAKLFIGGLVLQGINIE
jgi:hypothetical protein